MKESGYIKEIIQSLENYIQILSDNYIRKLGGKLTVLYIRLSREDEKDRESNSISNQRALLLDYANINKLKNIMIFYDEGI